MLTLKVNIDNQSRKFRRKKEGGTKEWKCAMMEH